MMRWWTHLIFGLYGHRWQQLLTMTSGGGWYRYLRCRHCPRAEHLAGVG